MESLQSSLQLYFPDGYQRGRCGYCHSSEPKNFSYYVTAHSLTAQAYQSLLERGFRRSGTLLYKPDLRAQCCKHYTIRLDAKAYQAKKPHRQVVNRFNQYVLGNEFIQELARRFPKTRQEKAKRDAKFVLTERIHESEFTKLPCTGIKEAPLATGDSSSKPRPSSKPRSTGPVRMFHVSLEPSDFTEEKFALFENYQRTVHHEPPNRITRSGFKSFLCSSPIQREEQTSDGRVRRLGSYHQCYRLDNQLVAIGVLDFLPDAISSVYLMYHESVAQWNFGKLSAIREISLAVEGGYKWYMMGFYIHSCSKMRYKGEYHPQYVLDPESYGWDLLDEDLKRRLDERPYVSMSYERANGITSEAGDVPKTYGSNGAIEAGGSKTKNEDNISPSTYKNLPLFQRGMPGVMSRAELESKVDLDHIKISLRGYVLDVQDLRGWDDDHPGTIKGEVVDLVSAIGPELASELCLYVP